MLKTIKKIDKPAIFQIFRTIIYLALVILSFQPLHWAWCWFNKKIYQEKLQTAKLVRDITSVERSKDCYRISEEIELPSEETFSETKKKSRWW